MQFIFDDGGRKAAGFKGVCGDCVTRSIAIATGIPYADVYRELGCITADHAATHRDQLARRVSAKGVSVRDGVNRKIYRRYLASIGWSWVPTMQIGSGCTVHLHDGELPSGRLIVRLSKHLTAVIDGVIHDTHDPQRNDIVCENGVQRISRRCVYGYFKETT